MTNYEKIINMSIEDMTDKLYETTFQDGQMACKICCDNKCNAYDTLIHSGNYICKQKIKKWLKSKC